MFGWGYARDFCIALFRKEKEEELFRHYVCNCLKICTENTANAIIWASQGRGNGMHMSKTLYEIMKPKPIDTRTGDEIVQDMKAKMDKFRGEQ